MRILAAEGGADVNKRCFHGQTPLFQAAAQGHEVVVRFLATTGGADVNAPDARGQTPVQIAMAHSHTSITRMLLVVAGATDASADRFYAQDMHAVAAEGDHAAVRFYVTVGGTDANTPDEDGNAPLHLAAIHGHEAVVHFFATEAGADVNASDKHGKTPLWHAARQNHKSVVTILLQAGATGSSDALVKQVRREILMLEDGAEPPKQLRLYFTGFAGVGKSTLMQSLCTSKLAAVFTNTGSTTAPDPGNKSERTLGVNVKRADVPGVGMLSLWDFAGQPEYYMSHGLLMGRSSIFVVLCSLADPPAEQQSQVLFWLRFIRARHPAKEDVPKPVVLLAGSCRDRPHPDSGVTKVSTGARGAAVWSATVSKGLLATAQQQFGSSLDIDGRFFYLDCARTRGVEMTAFRACLHARRQALLAQAPKVPRICTRLLSSLGKTRKEATFKPIWPTGELVEAMLQHIGISDANSTGRAAATDALSYLRDRVRTAFAHLHDMGEVIFYETNTHLSDWIVLDPSWFGQRIIGVVLAPATVAVTARATLRDGVIATEELHRILTAYKVQPGQIEPALMFLEAMELCYPASGGEGIPAALVFPALLRRSGEEQTARWSPHESPAYTAWGGRWLNCASTVDMLPPQYFPRLQTRLALLCRKEYNTELDAWQTGAVVSCSNELGAVQCLVEVDDPDRTHVAFTVRGRSDGDRMQCLALLNRLVHLAQELANKPDMVQGIELVVEAISPNSIGQKKNANKHHFIPVLDDAAQLGGVVCTPSISRCAESGTTTLQCHTPGAEMYYSLDNTAPSHSATRYTNQPFHVVGASVMALAYKVGMIPSAVCTLSVEAVETPSEENVLLSQASKQLALRAYGSLVDIACADGVLTDTERGLLEKKRVELGITEEEHHAGFAHRLDGLSKAAGRAADTASHAQSQQLLVVQAKIDQLMSLQLEERTNQQEIMHVMYTIRDDQKVILQEVNEFQAALATSDDQAPWLFVVFPYDSRNHNGGGLGGKVAKAKAIVKSKFTIEHRLHLLCNGRKDLGQLPHVLFSNKNDLLAGTGQYRGYHIKKLTKYGSAIKVVLQALSLSAGAASKSHITRRVQKSKWCYIWIRDVCLLFLLDPSTSDAGGPYQTIPNQVLNPQSLTKTFTPHLIYDTLLQAVVTFMPALAGQSITNYNIAPPPFQNGAKFECEMFFLLWIPAPFVPGLRNQKHVSNPE